MTEEDKLEIVDENLLTIASLLEECSADDIEFKDDYERYMALSRIYVGLKKLSEEYLEKSDAIMKYLIDHKETVSDKYEIIFPANTKRAVDIAKLQENPKLFDECVFIKDAFITKAFGRKRLREMFCEEYGDKAYGFLTANVTDVEKIAGKSDAAKYMTVDEKRTEYPIMVEKGSYPADYYLNGNDELIKVFSSNIEDKPPKAFSKIKIEL